MTALNARRSPRSAAANAGVNLFARILVYSRVTDWSTTMIRRLSYIDWTFSNTAESATALMLVAAITIAFFV
jgi:hypothetical protein